MFACDDGLVKETTCILTNKHVGEGADRIITSFKAGYGDVIVLPAVSLRGVDRKCNEGRS